MMDNPGLNVLLLLVICAGVIGLVLSSIKKGSTPPPRRDPE